MRITYVVVKEYVSNDDNEPNMVVAIILLVRGILEGRIDIHQTYYVLGTMVIILFSLHYLILIITLLRKVLLFPG